MKFLDKASLILFSFLVLVLSMIMCLLMIGWVSVGDINWVLNWILQNSIASKITIGVCIVLILLAVNVLFILLSIKCIFFRKSDKKEKNEEQGILLQNENGKLIISKDTIENLVNSIIKQFDSIEGTTTSISLNSENNLIINLNLTVGENVVIKELSANMQEKIKTSIKAALDLDAKEVNIKIKNYSVKKENATQQ